MLFESNEEEFKIKPKFVKEKEIEGKINGIMQKLDIMTQQVELLSKYISTISKKVGKALDASVAYQRDLDDLERRVNLIKSKMEQVENVVPEVRFKEKFGVNAS